MKEEDGELEGPTDGPLHPSSICLEVARVHIVIETAIYQTSDDTTKLFGHSLDCMLLRIRDNANHLSVFFV